MRNEKVWVYQYTYWDEASRTHKTSTQYATMDAIRNGLGIPVLSSERKVWRADLTHGEMYVPKEPKEPKEESAASLSTNEETEANPPVDVPQSVAKESLP